MHLSKHSNRLPFETVIIEAHEYIMTTGLLITQHFYLDVLIQQGCIVCYGNFITVQSADIFVVSSLLTIKHKNVMDNGTMRPGIQVT